MSMPSVDPIQQLWKRAFTLSATIDSAKKLHAPWKLYDDCGHEHLNPNEPGVHLISELGYVCEDGFLYAICHHCCTHNSDVQSEDCVDGHHHGRNKPHCATITLLSKVGVE